MLAELVPRFTELVKSGIGVGTKVSLCQASVLLLGENKLNSCKMVNFLLFEGVGWGMFLQKESNVNYVSVSCIMRKKLQ